uniref:UL52 n=1 Tax=Human herpesvirus 2 TaxID=10310 RepID=A0A481TQS7_HHV2|nr:UL52 [Human alphaherpesvirus 2]
MALTVAIVHNAPARIGSGSTAPCMSPANRCARSSGACPWGSAASPRCSCTTRRACWRRTAGRIMGAPKAPFGF